MRRLLALGCLTAAIVLAISVLRPPPPPLAAVLVTTTDLSAGHVLTDADVSVAAVPEAGAAPGALTDPVEAVGRPLAVAAPAGTTLTATTVLGPGLLAAAPAGTVVIAVPLSTPGEALLAEPGRTVTLLAAPPHGANGPAVDVGEGVVLATIGASPQVTSLLSEVDGPGEATTYVAVPRNAATVIVGAGATGTLTVIAGH